jgi:manganese/iron transport system ATP-binding protein/manganese/zinc/iron transport system ATP- binding protein
MNEQNNKNGRAAVPAVEIKHLTVSYGLKVALLDISLSIAGGQLIGIIGPNGAGKSTLVKAILGLVKPDFGTIQVLGQPIAAQKGAVAYVPQRESVDWDFPISVAEVIMLGRYGHIPWWSEPSADDRRLADEALRMVRIEEFRDQQIGQLSGGQQQRVFIARALAQQTDILILDEPLAGVDAATERSILELLVQVKQSGRTLLVVHHDLATAAQYFDQLVLVKQRLYAFGPPAAVLRADLLSEVYGGRLREFTHLNLNNRNG